MLGRVGDRSAVAERLSRTSLGRPVGAGRDKPAHVAPDRVNARRTSSPDFPRIQTGNLRFVLLDSAECDPAAALNSLKISAVWSGRRDSNPRPQPWQGCALPLSYTRIRKPSSSSRTLPKTAVLMA